MKITLNEMRYENIRDFKNFKINLLSDKGNSFHISLVQMPNGTGKTTTIELIQFALFGKDFTPFEVRSYEPTRFEAPTGSFELLYKVDNEKHSIKLVFDYEAGSYKYSTSSPKSDGYLRDHNLPRQIRSIMSESFSKLFIFDGELATDLFNATKTEADSAIQSVFYLDRFTEIKTGIDEILDDKIKKAQGTKIKEVQAIKTLQNKLTSLKDKRISLQKDLEQREHELFDKSTELDRINNQLREITTEDEKFRSRHDEITSAIKSKEKEIVANTSVVINNLKTPSNWSSVLRADLSNLRQNMDQLRLPKTASSEFFLELSKSHSCICGIELDDSKRQNIKNMSETYLDDDATAVMNAMKTSIRQIAALENPGDLFKEINDMRADLAELNQDKNILERSSSEDRRELFDELNPLKQNLEREVSELQDFVTYTKTRDTQLINSVGLDHTVNLALLDEEIEKETKKLATAADSVAFNEKSKKLKELLSYIRENAMIKIKKNLVKETNDKIGKILVGEKVAIDDIRHSLIIEGKSGVSQGQSVAVGYSFISTLFENKTLELPFIIDSPAGPLDYTVRRKIANILPNLFHQLILFVIPSEKPAFVNHLAKYSNERGIQYFTASKNKEDMGAMLCYPNDTSYFDEFDIEEDD